MKIVIYKTYKNGILLGKDKSVHEALMRASQFTIENICIEKAVYNTRTCSETHICKILNDPNLKKNNKKENRDV